MNSALNIVQSSVAYFRKRNTWYTVKDGLWSDPATWQGTGKRRYAMPQEGDSIVISHAVTLNNAAFPAFVTKSFNDITVTGSMIVAAGANSMYLTVNNTFDAGKGTVDLSAGSCSLTLLGQVNYFGILNQGGSSIYYNGNSGQVVYAPLISGSYTTLYFQFDSRFPTPTTSNKSLKVLGGDITCTNFQTYFASLDINGFNLISTGTFSANGGGGAAITNSKNTGSISISSLNGAFIDTPSSPIYLKAIFGAQGGSGSTINASNTYITQTGTFNTANNSIAFGGGSVIIKSGITLTVDNTAYLSFNGTGTVQGEDSTSVLTCGATGHVKLAGAIDAPMQIGVFNANGTIWYSCTQAGIVTMTKTVYNNLYFYEAGGENGQVTIKLSGNTVVNGTMWMYQSKVDLNGFNLTQADAAKTNQTCFNTRVINSGTAAKLSWGGATGSIGGFTFNAPGSTLEFKQNLPAASSNAINNVTGILRAANSITMLGLEAWNIIGSISIADSATLATNTAIDITGAINGEGAGSVLDNRGAITYRYAGQPMQTGAMQCNNAVNTFRYSLAGAQDITPGTYRNLILNGSGVKKLLGNVSVVNTYTLTAPATLNSNGFTLTNP